MRNIDQRLWARELAEHLRKHPDLQHLPPPVFPQQSEVGYLLALSALVFVLVPLAAMAGWEIGMHLI